MRSRLKTCIAGVVLAGCLSLGTMVRADDAADAKRAEAQAAAAKAEAEAAAAEANAKAQAAQAEKAEAAQRDTAAKVEAAKAEAVKREAAAREQREAMLRKVMEAEKSRFADKAQAERGRVELDAAQAQVDEARRQVEAIRLELRRAERQVAEADKQGAEAIDRRKALMARDEAAEKATALKLLEDQLIEQKVRAGGAAGNALDTYRVRRLPVEAKLEKAPFLGVTTSPVPASLREQLKLQKGIGLVVDTVDPKSPAAQAGVKQYDILQKLNDQFLINSHQLSVLVRTLKVGQDVELTIVREGKTSTLGVKLAERDLPPLDDTNPWGAVPGGPAFFGDAGGGDVFLNAVPFQHPAVAGFTRGDERRMAVVRDDDWEIVLNRKDGALRLLAREAKTGKEVFNGPIDTDEQRKNLPDDLRKRIDSPPMDKMILDFKAQGEAGARFRFEQGGGLRLDGPKQVEIELAPPIERRKEKKEVLTEPRK